MKKSIAIVLAVLVFLPLILAGCQKKEEKPEFDGQGTVQFDLGDSFTVNIKDQEKKYLYCSATLNLNNSDEVTVFTEKLSWIRQAIIDIIRSKTLDELNAEDATVALSDAIVAKVNETFKSEAVYSVSFPVFYVYNS